MASTTASNLAPTETVFRARPEPATIVAIVLLATVVVVLATQLAYAAANQGPTMFAARSQVQYQGSSWVETESERVKSRTLIEPVAIAHGISIDEFESNWDAGQVPGTQILQFEYRHAQPETALSVVESATSRYLAEAELLAATPNPALQAYSELEQSLIEELAVIEASISALGTAEGSAQLTALFQEKASVRTAIDSVRLAKINLGLFDRSEVVPQVVTEPFSLSDPVAPLPERQAVFGFLGGSLVAVAIGLLALRIAANRREKSPSRVALVTLGATSSRNTLADVA